MTLGRPPGFPLRPFSNGRPLMLFRPLSSASLAHAVFVVVDPLKSYAVTSLKPGDNTLDHFLFPRTFLDRLKARANA
jgi:hypothetical protein